jgi:hypothetical protein
VAETMRYKYHGKFSFNAWHGIESP